MSAGLVVRQLVDSAIEVHGYARVVLTGGGVVFRRGAVDVVRLPVGGLAVRMNAPEVPGRHSPPVWRIEFAPGTPAILFFAVLMNVVTEEEG